MRHDHTDHRGTRLASARRLPQTRRSMVGSILHRPRRSHEGRATAKLHNMAPHSASSRTATAHHIVRRNIRTPTQPARVVCNKRAVSARVYFRDQDTDQTTHNGPTTPPIFALRRPTFASRTHNEPLHCTVLLYGGVSCNPDFD